MTEPVGGSLPGDRAPGDGAPGAGDRSLPDGLGRRAVAAAVLGACISVSVLVVAVRVTALGELTFRWVGLAGLSPLVAGSAALGATVAAALAIRSGPSPGQRSWPRWALSTLFVWGVALWTVAPEVVGIVAPEAPSAGEGVTVATQNLWYLHPDPAEAANGVLAVDADVLVLVEYTPAHAAALSQAGVGRYPYRWTDAAEAGDGLAVFSRFPLEDVRKLATSAPAVEAELVLPGGPVQLVAWHPRAPREPWGLLEWQADYSRLTDHLAGATQDLVVVGDFNATDAHRPLRRLAGAAGLRDAATVSGDGLQATWSALGPLPPLMRLDRVMVGDGIGVHGTELMSTVGSDHLGVVARLQYPRS